MGNASSVRCQVITREQWLEHAAKTFDEHPRTKADADGVLCFPIAAYASLSKALTKPLAKPSEAEEWLENFAQTKVPPQELRVAELEALQAALTEAATNLDVLDIQQKAMPPEGSYPDWMDRLDYMGEGRTVAAAKAGLAAAVKANKEQGEYARSQLATLTPIVVKEITPALVKTRSQYDALAQKMAAKEAAALEALRTQLSGWNKAAAAVAGGGKATQRLTEEASQEFFDKPSSALGADDERDPRFGLAMLSDALRVKPTYDEELRRIGAAVNERVPGSVDVLCAPLKSMSRGMVKIHGKYQGSYKKLTDVLRGTLVCANVEVAVLCAEELSRGGILVPKRAKNRIDPSFDAGSAGGYRCVPCSRHSPA